MQVTIPKQGEREAAELAADSYTLEAPPTADCETSIRCGLRKECGTALAPIRRPQWVEFRRPQRVEFRRPQWAEFRRPQRVEFRRPQRVEFRRPQWVEFRRPQRVEFRRPQCVEPQAYSGHLPALRSSQQRTPRQSYTKT
jgi:hypothetical protein